MSDKSTDPTVAKWVFTKHAIQQYRERTGSTSMNETRIKKKIAYKLESRRHIEGDRWFADGLIFVIIRRNVIITAMKPIARRLQDRIYHL